MGLDVSYASHTREGKSNEKKKESEKDEESKEKTKEEKSKENNKEKEEQKEEELKQVKRRTASELLSTWWNARMALCSDSQIVYETIRWSVSFGFLALLASSLILLVLVFWSDNPRAYVLDIPDRVVWVAMFAESIVATTMTLFSLSGVTQEMQSQMSILKSLALRLEAESIWKPEKPLKLEIPTATSTTSSASLSNNSNNNNINTSIPNNNKNHSDSDENDDDEDEDKNSNTTTTTTTTTNSNNIEPAQPFGKRIRFRPLHLTSSELQELDTQAKKISDYLKNNDDYPQIFFFYVKPTFFKFLIGYLAAWWASVGGAFIKNEA
jgi:hypothetical protein